MHNIVNTTPAKVVVLPRDHRAPTPASSLLSTETTFGSYGDFGAHGHDHDDDNDNNDSGNGRSWGDGLLVVGLLAVAAVVIAVSASTGHGWVEFKDLARESAARFWGLFGGGGGGQRKRRRSRRSRRAQEDEGGLGQRWLVWGISRVLLPIAGACRWAEENGVFDG